MTCTRPSHVHIRDPPSHHPQPVRKRWLSRLRQGWYSSEHLEAETQWRARVLAAVRAHRRILVLSHAHAARAYGWPVPLGGWGPLSFTATSPPARRAADVRVLVASLEDHEVVQRGVVLVTSPARTLVDCARHLPQHDALALADRALRRHDVSVSSLASALEGSAGRRGIERARKVLALADGQRESPFESWSAWAFWVQGLPTPDWQVTVLDDEGVFLGRADAWWKEGVAGEADGRAKYRLGALERTGAVDAEGLAGVLDDERRRERELRRAGVVIVRWEPRDVLQTDRQRRLAAQLRGEIDEAGTHPRFTGNALVR